MCTFAKESQWPITTLISSLVVLRDLVKIFIFFFSFLLEVPPAVVTDEQRQQDRGRFIGNDRVDERRKGWKKCSEGKRDQLKFM